MDDNAIISAIKNGSTYGYKYLFDRHYGSVNYFIYRMVNNLTETEDLTMITFEKAFSRLDGWEPRAKFSTWLFSIARNTVLDFIIAEKRRIQGGIELDKYVQKPDNNTPSPYQELIANELKNVIEGHINRLPKKGKAVMKLHYIGYSDEEIVEKLSMMHGNVRCLLSRAKQKLKDKLHEQNDPVINWICA